MDRAFCEAPGLFEIGPGSRPGKEPFAGPHDALLTNEGIQAVQHAAVGARGRMPVEGVGLKPRPQTLRIGEIGIDGDLRGQKVTKRTFHRFIFARGPGPVGALAFAFVRGHLGAPFVVCEEVRGKYGLVPHICQVRNGEQG